MMHGQRNIKFFILVYRSDLYYSEVFMLGAESLYLEPIKIENMGRNRELLSEFTPYANFFWGGKCEVVHWIAIIGVVLRKHRRMSAHAWRFSV